MRRMVGGSMMVLAVMAGAASAQTAGPVGSGMPGGGSVIHPAPSVDPGMKVIRPKVPPVSTPVIKPRTTTRDGTVVVPK